MESVNGRHIAVPIFTFPSESLSLHRPPEEDWFCDCLTCRAPLEPPVAVVKLEFGPPHNRHVIQLALCTACLAMMEEADRIKVLIEDLDDA